MPAGFVATQSSFGFDETLDRLVEAVTGRGMSVLARIEHATAATAIGLALRPTTVILFGNPRAGTPLMQAAQTIGIDLPLKVLVWEDGEGVSWLGYNDPVWLAGRHSIELQAPSLEPMTAMLETISREVAEKLV